MARDNIEVDKLLQIKTTASCFILPYTPHEEKLESETDEEGRQREQKTKDEESISRMNVKLQKEKER